MRFRFLTTALLILLSIGQFHAQDFVIDNYKVDIKINQEGYFDIHELIEVEFLAKRRGIFRDVPRKVKINGQLVKAGLSNVQVNGHNFKVLNEGGVSRIRIGDPDVYLTGKQVYDISYRISNAFVFDSLHTEFLYNLVHEWNTTVGNLEYTIELPTDLNMAFNDYKIITGMEGEDERNASIEKNGRIFSGKTFRALDKNEMVTVAIKLPADYIKRPEPKPSVLEQDKLWFIPIAFIIFLFNNFRRSRKEFVPTAASKVHFPPEGFSPAEVGAYHDYRVNTEDIIALIPYWAAQGNIKIMSNQMQGDDEDLYFKKLKDLDSNAPNYQHTVFNALFESDSLILLSELKNKIYKIIYKASGEIKKSLLGKNMYDADHYNFYHTGKFIAGGLVLILTGVLCIIFSSFLLTGIATIIMGVFAIIIHFLRPKRSEKGIRIKSQLDALKETLSNSSGDENYAVIKEHPNYFEKIYPFVIALGIDKQWIEKLQDYDIPAPYWYGYYGNNMHASRPSFNSFSESFSVPEIKSAFVSQPSSGGGGGFSGGSSGGGFGGGGGSW